MVVAATVAVAAVSAAASYSATTSAADTQAGAANNATNAQLAMYNQTQANLSPYIGSGTQANNSLSNLSGVGTANPLSSPLLSAPNLPPQMTEDQLKQTPGYQFNLSQGLESVQNSAAARGLGNSGAALKGAAAYATGLADSTYQNQFNNYQQLYSDTVTNQTNQFNRLLSLSSLGENAAAGLGNNATQTGANIGNNIIGAGNAQGASYIAGANGVNNALQGGFNSYLLNGYLNNPGSSGGANLSDVGDSGGIGGYLSGE